MAQLSYLQQIAQRSRGGLPTLVPPRSLLRRAEVLPLPVLLAEMSSSPPPAPDISRFDPASNSDLVQPSAPLPPAPASETLTPPHRSNTPPREIAAPTTIQDQSVPIDDVVIAPQKPPQPIHPKDVATTTRTELVRLNPSTRSDTFRSDPLIPPQPAELNPAAERQESIDELHPLRSQTGTDRLLTGRSHSASTPDSVPFINAERPALETFKTTWLSPASVKERDRKEASQILPNLVTELTSSVSLPSPISSPQGNSIRIGSIDVQILPPPIPVPQASPSPPKLGHVSPLARGFASSFGLRQG
jgi:hypothetical protein